MNYFTYLDSPIGPILLSSNTDALTGLYMNTDVHGQEIGSGWVESDSVAPLLAAKEQLNAYFGGALQTFDLPLEMRGTEFQKRVWQELTNIPYGETISYGELARRIGNPNSSRAVGLANGQNPISIIVPCHRVIGASGKLVGYGGGLPRKEKLLALEASVLGSRGHSATQAQPLLPLSFG